MQRVVAQKLRGSTSGNKFTYGLPLTSAEFNGFAMNKADKKGQPEIWMTKCHRRTGELSIFSVAFAETKAEAWP
jgi:hypothetical protein